MRCRSPQIKQVWPPGSADTVCPRRPIMTHVAYSIGSRGLRLITWPCDLDLEGHGACGWCGSSSSIRVSSLKFVCLAVRKICCTMCVSVNRPGDLDLWFFDLETGMWVASKVGNLHSEFGHSKPSGSRVIRYIRDRRTNGRTDRQTDRQKQTLLQGA